MELIKLNGQAYHVPKISELTFKQFNKIMIKGRATDLKEYISLFTDIPIATLMNADFDGASIPSLYQTIFNVDIEAVIKDKKKTVEFDNKIYSVDDLSHATFGKNYFFELRLQQVKAKKLDYYSLCIYALSIALMPTTDADIGVVFKQMSNQNWMKVLPQGFFLAKKFNGSKLNSIRLSILFMLRLKMIKWMIKFSKKKSINREKI